MKIAGRAHAVKYNRSGEIEGILHTTHTHTYVAAKSEQEETEERTLTDIQVNWQWEERGTQVQEE